MQQTFFWLFFLVTVHKQIKFHTNPLPPTT